MKNSFICWSPYQLMNILNYVYSYCLGDDNDIYIINQGKMKTYKDGVEAINVFNRVVLVDKTDFGRGISNKINRYMYYLFPKHSLVKQLGENTVTYFNDYDYIFSTGFDPFFLNIISLCKKAHIVFLDDGLGFYLCDSRKVELSKKFRLFKFLQGKGWNGINIEKQYLNCPDLLLERYNIDTYKMPSVSNEIFEVLKKVFGYEINKEYYSRRIVYFGQPKSGFIANDDINKNIINILKRFGNDTVYRKHPIQGNDKYDYGVIYVDEGRCLWELICGECVNDNTILIGAFSNAQFTPYFLYEKKPTIILLNKMVLDKSSPLYKKVELFANNYNQKIKHSIYMPEDLSQLNELLERIMSRN